MPQPGREHWRCVRVEAAGKLRESNTRTGTDGRGAPRSSTASTLPSGQSERTRIAHVGTHTNLPARVAYRNDRHTSIDVAKNSGEWLPPNPLKC